MKLLPAGAQTYSRAPSRYPPSAPERMMFGDGARVFDGAGNAYIDTVNGLGAVILGHRHPEVEEAVRAAMEQGNALPTPTDAEEEAARALLRCLTWEGAESVRFAKNGADVTGAAVRLARAVTGREHAVMWEGGYHGHHDWSIAAPMDAGVPGTVRGLTHRVPWMDMEALAEVFKDYPVACLVSEPAVTAFPAKIPTADMWDDVRALCYRHDVLLVLDEMVTGFRVAVGGGAERWSIRPDIACYGKAMGNGYSVSAIVGPWRFMRRFEEDVFFSTTHGGEGVGLAAARTTLDIVRQENVPARLAELGNEILAFPGTTGYPQRPVLDGWTPEALDALVREHHVLCQGYVNLTLAHVENTVIRERLLSALRATAPEAEENAA